MRRNLLTLLCTKQTNETRQVDLERIRETIVVNIDPFDDSHYYSTLVIIVSCRFDPESVNVYKALSIGKKK